MKDSQDSLLLQERRQTPRINCSFHGRLTSILGGTLPQEGVVANLSEGRVLFINERRYGFIKVGDPVILCFDLEGEGKIEAKGRIIYRLFQQKPSYGIKFRNISDGVKPRIRDYVG